MKNAMDDTICGSCKYDLSASPSIGSCPECGKYFNRRTGEGILQTHEAPANAGDKIMRLVAGIGLLVFAGFLLMCGGFIAYARGNGRPFWIMFVVAMVVVMAAATKLIRGRNPY